MLGDVASGGWRRGSLGPAGWPEKSVKVLLPTASGPVTLMDSVYTKI
jgi:hypothetical protein